MKIKPFFYILTILSLMIIFSCNNNQSNNNEEQDDSLKTDTVKTDTVEITIVEVEKENSLYYKNFKYLPNITDTIVANRKIINYVEVLLGEVTSEAQILQALDKRDSLFFDMEMIISEYYYTSGEENYEEWAAVEEELLKLGFICIYAEGMYGALDNAPILEEAIEKYASEPLKLFIKFNNLYAATKGGEYPYLTVRELIPTIVTGEELLSKHKNSEYAKKITEDMMGIISRYTDYHKVTGTVGFESDCCYSGLTYDFWPFAHACGEIEFFIEEYPNSMFYEPIKKIFEYPSSIDVSENGDRIAYIIVTDKSETWTTGKTQIWNYLLEGKDIPHLILLFKNGDTENNEWYVAYRFFSDKPEADNALEKAKKLVPKSYMIEATLDGEIIE